MKKIRLQINTKTQCSRIMRDALTACVQAEVFYAQILCAPIPSYFGTAMIITNVIEEDIESILFALDNSPIIESWNVLSYEEWDI